MTVLVRRRALRLAAALAAAASAGAPRAARAYEWAGTAAAGYTQLDVRDEGVSSTSPRLDVDLSLDLVGSVGRGFLDWHGAAAYRRSRTEVDGEETTASDQFRYRLETALFANFRSPVELQASAYRVDQDHRLGGADGTVGEFVTEGLQLRGEYISPVRPKLVVVAGREKTTYQFAGVDTREQERDRLRVTALHAAGPLQADVTYQGEFGDGTFPSDRYASHSVGADATVSLPGDYRLGLTDTVYFRDPTDGEATGTFAMQLHRFEAFAAGGMAYGDRQEFRYQYNRTLVNTSALSNEFTTQRLSWGADRRLRSPEWSLGLNAALQVSDLRADADSQRTSSELVGGTLWWRRATETGTRSLYGGTVVGLTQLGGGENSFSYGGSAGASASAQRSVYALSGQYDVSFLSADTSASTWTLSQTASGSVSRPVGMRSLSGNLLASAARSRGSLGDSASRSLYLSAALTARAYAFRITGSLNSTTGAAIAPGGLAGDGLLIPAPFDQHVLSLVASAQAILPYRLSLSGDFGVSESRGPGAPDELITQAHGALSYAIGALSISLSDAFYSSGEFLGGRRVNVVTVTVSRRVGGGS